MFAIYLMQPECNKNRSIASHLSLPRLLSLRAHGLLASNYRGLCCRYAKQLLLAPHSVAVSPAPYCLRSKSSFVYFKNLIFTKKWTELLSCVSPQRPVHLTQIDLPASLNLALVFSPYYIPQHWHQSPHGRVEYWPQHLLFGSRRQTSLLHVANFNTGTRVGIIDVGFPIQSIEWILENELFLICSANHLGYFAVFAVSPFTLLSVFRVCRSSFLSAAIFARTKAKFVSADISYADILDVELSDGTTLLYSLEDVYYGTGRENDCICRSLYRRLSPLHQTPLRCAECMKGRVKELKSSSLRLIFDSAHSRQEKGYRRASGKLLSLGPYSHHHYVGRRRTSNSLSDEHTFQVKHIRTGKLLAEIGTEERSAFNLDSLEQSVFFSPDQISDLLFHQTKTHCVAYSIQPGSVDVGDCTDANYKLSQQFCIYFPSVVLAHSSTLGCFDGDTRERSYDTKDDMEGIIGVGYEDELDVFYVYGIANNRGYLSIHHPTSGTCLKMYCFQEMGEWDNLDTHSLLLDTTFIIHQWSKLSRQTNSIRIYHISANNNS